MRVGSGVGVLCALIPSLALALDVDLRRPGYSMQYVRSGSQYGGTCYAESAAMAIDAFRYSWMGFSTQTYVDPVHLGILDNRFMESDSLVVSRNENQILQSIKNGKFDRKLLGFPMEGGYSGDVIQLAMNKGFCINTNQTHSILTRFGQEYDPFSSFESFYKIYSYYKQSEWDLLKLDLYFEPYRAVADHTYVKMPDPLIGKFKMPEPPPQTKRPSIDMSKHIETMSAMDFDQRFTKEDKVAYSNFLQQIYMEQGVLSSVDFLYEMTTQSCKIDKTLTPKLAQDLMYYHNESDTRTSKAEVQKKKKILHDYFKIAEISKMVQPLILSYCVDEALETNATNCGYHASLIIGIKPTENGNVLILHNTYECTAEEDNENVTCDKTTGDYLVDENVFLKSTRIMHSMVPIIEQSLIDQRSKFSPEIESKLVDGWNYMVYAGRLSEPFEYTQDSYYAIPNS